MATDGLVLLEVGKRIADRRKRLGLTQEALAEKAEVTTQFVSYAESGKRAMRPEKPYENIDCSGCQRRLFAYRRYN